MPLVTHCTEADFIIENRIAYHIFAFSQLLLFDLICLVLFPLGVNYVL